MDVIRLKHVQARVRSRFLSNGGLWDSNRGASLGSVVSVRVSVRVRVRVSVRVSIRVRIIF